MSTLGAVKSVERLERLAQGVVDRGSALSANWRAECAQRPDGRTVDVNFYSPSGLKFRSYLEVYRHLGLPAEVGSQQLAKKNKRSKSSSDGYKGATGGQQAGEATHSNPDAEGTNNLPEALQQIPITCNSKQGTWHVALNKVECRDNNCLICGDKLATDRFMARSGLHGFTKHSGLPEQSYWKNVFKVNLPDAQGLSLEQYFNQHNCSLTSLRAGSPTTAHGHVGDINKKSSKPSVSAKTAKAAKRHKHAAVARHQTASPVGTTSSGKPGPSATKTANTLHVSGELHSAEPSGSGTPHACCEQAVPNTVVDDDDKPGDMCVVKKSVMTEEIARLQARHDAEMKALKAQIAEGRLEHAKSVKEIARLSTELYDVKTGSMPCG